MKMDNQQANILQEIPKLIYNKIMYKVKDSVRKHIPLAISSKEGARAVVRRLTKLKHKDCNKIISEIKQYFITVPPSGFVPIKGYEEYLVSKDGLIIRAKTRKILTQYSDRDGYLQVRIQLYKKCLRVHRAVMYGFNDVSDLPVDHIDGNKQNNHLSNLEYVTVTENNKRAYALGLKNSSGENNPMAKLTKAEVAFIRFHSVDIPADLLMKKYNIGRTAINDIRNGRTWKNIDLNDYPWRGSTL